MVKERLLIVSPVFNESAHLERVIAAMAGQTRPPDEWIVVDDGSDDRTPALLREAVRDVPFLRVVGSAAGGPVAGGDRLLAASEARAFNRGLRLASPHTHVGKLDGDVELPSGYYENLLGRFREDPRLGIAGGVLTERSAGRWQVRGASDLRHVRGAVKLYTRECFQTVGGVREMLGWDAIDEVLARMNGYRTRSFEDLVARHHRAAGSAQGRLRGELRLGRSMYVEGYPPHWIAARAVTVATSMRPRGLSGLAFGVGYGAAALHHVPRFDGDGYRRQLRRELRARAGAAARLPLPAGGGRRAR